LDSALCEGPLLKNEVEATARDSQHHIIIIGGGFSGTALAIQLLRRALGGISIAVINRAGLPGRGVAYSTDCEDHLLNVGAGKMSSIADQPEDFLHWLILKLRKVVKPEDFVPRRLYGEYLEEMLAQTKKDHPEVAFSWFDQEAISLTLKTSKPFVKLSNGVGLRAEIAVLATGHALPGSPAEVQAITKRFYSSYAWARDALEGIPDSGTVLILGSGLTAVDQILALRSRRFHGRIFLLSRRGQLPAAHSTSATWPSDWADALPDTVCGILKSVRQQIKLASADGVDWHAVIDSLRPMSPHIWHRWSVRERKRFLRHVRTHWEVSRHRVPQTTHQILMDLVADSSLRVIAGRLIKVVEHDQYVDVTLCERGTQKYQSFSIDRIINCTGPVSFHRVQDRLIVGLLRDGLAQLDPLQLGIDTGRDGLLISKSGEPSNCIYTIGPVRKACDWETTAVAEIREQAAQLAIKILDQLMVADRKADNPARAGFIRNSPIE
jgi:uncharacterized NAD(P)/FAD-binding protein YdhS